MLYVRNKAWRQVWAIQEGFVSHHKCEWNCGSTTCHAPYRPYTSIRCDHESTWEYDVSIWFFKKRVYVCTECGLMMDKTFKVIG